MGDEISLPATGTPFEIVISERLKQQFCLVQPRTVAGVGTPTPVIPRGSRYALATSAHASASEPGHLHELTFSCFRGFSFLGAERTCQWLADAINAARAKFNISLWAYVFMPDHVHLLICPNEPDYNVSMILKAIKQPVGSKAIKHLSEQAPHWLERITAQHRNRVERRFWEVGGGFDRNTIEPHVIPAMIDYIHGNPVRKQLVDKPEDWKWSSAGWVEGKHSLRPDPVEFGGPVVGGMD